MVGGGGMAGNGGSGGGSHPNSIHYGSDGGYESSQIIQQQQQQQMMDHQVRLAAFLWGRCSKQDPTLFQSNSQMAIMKATFNLASKDIDPNFNFSF